MLSHLNRAPYLPREGNKLDWTEDTWQRCLGYVRSYEFRQLLGNTTDSLRFIGVEPGRKAPLSLDLQVNLAKLNAQHTFF